MAQQAKRKRRTPLKDISKTAGVIQARKFLKIARGAATGAFDTPGARRAVRTGEKALLAAVNKARGRKKRGPA